MWLMSNGAALDGRDYYLHTPLMHAACASKPLLVELLLRRGAKVDEVDASGATALHLAVASAYMAQEGVSHKRCFRCVPACNRRLAPSLNTRASSLDLLPSPRAAA